MWCIFVCYVRCIFRVPPYCIVEGVSSSERGRERERGGEGGGEGGGGGGGGERESLPSTVLCNFQHHTNFQLWCRRGTCRLCIFCVVPAFLYARLGVFLESPFTLRIVLYNNIMKVFLLREREGEREGGREGRRTEGGRERELVP